MRKGMEFNMANIVVVAVVLVIIGAAIAYIIKEKKKGVKCIGCSAAGSCSHNCSGTSGCGSHTNTKE